MPALASEAFIFRTYPFQEGDLIVSFFTRDQGKLRGVARRARRPKNSFGAGLERLSRVTMSYYQRENRELVNLNSCDVLESQFGLAGEYCSQFDTGLYSRGKRKHLPAAEPSERFFRLLLAVLGYLHSNPTVGVWPAISYFSLWAVRLSGILPELRLSAESRLIAEEMMQTPISQLSQRSWSRNTASDLRRFLVRGIEEHVERRLQTAPLLETL